MKRVLITGANRGIGLALCKQVHERGDEPIAVCRRPSEELDALGVRIVEDIDLGEAGAARALDERLGDLPLDVLILNAGILERVSFEELDLDSIRRQFEINALAPLRVTRALVDRLGPGSKVAIITSLMGSMGDNGSGSHYGYRMSKAAVNAAGVSLSHDLKPRGIAVAILHPGLVSTDMTGHRGITTEESAAGLLARIDGVDLDSSGTFWHADGRKLPW